ncbi:hypothetical protein CRENBAI_005352 [Crenichthys baileyi]|uniref:Uncharacterized protein n=1 Tax=Crenichthys baileyi TaxID=28760 RepID=A0AAV9SLB0_9TELE
MHVSPSPLIPSCDRQVQPPQLKLRCDQQVQPPQLKLSKAHRVKLRVELVP